MFTKPLVTVAAGAALVVGAIVPASAMPSVEDRVPATPSATVSVVHLVPAVPQADGRQKPRRPRPCGNDYPASVVTSTEVKLWGRTAEYGEDIGAHVLVKAPGARQRLEGTVTVAINGADLAPIEIGPSGAFVELPSRLATGPVHEVSATFAGPRCSRLMPSTSPALTFDIVPTPGTVTVAAPAVRRGDRAVLAVRARTGSGITAQGTVSATVSGPRKLKATARLVKGRTRIDLGRLTKPGTYRVTVQYRAGKGIKGDKATATVRVTNGRR